MNSGIYKIENIKNGKFYIGSSINFMKRKSSHFRALIMNKHPNSHLQSSFNKHGEDNFKFEVLVYCPKEYCTKFEQWFISNLNPDYNIRQTAESNLGLKASKETKLKMSKSRKGKPLKDNRNPIISKNIETGEKQLFDSTIEASKYYNCHPTSITRVLTGKRYSNNGYRFFYKDESKRSNAIVKENNNKGGLKFLNKLTEDKVKEIKLLLRESKTNREIALLYGVHEVTIGQIKNNKIWKKISI